MKKKYLNIAGNVLLYMGVFFVVSQIFSFLIKIGYETKGLTELLDFLLVEMKLHVVAFFVIPFLIYLLIFRIRKENFSEFCRLKKLSAHDFILVTLIGIAMFIFTSHFINISLILEKVPQYDEYVSFIETGNPAMSLIMLSIIIPFVEEILFRGLILNEMRKGLPLFLVLLIHPLFYMPFQPNIQVAVFAYINFTIFGLIYIFTGSIWSSILVEVVSAIGLFGMRLLGIEQKLDTMGDPYLITVTVICFVLILFGTFKLKKKNLKEIFSVKEAENSNFPLPERAN